MHKMLRIIALATGCMLVGGSHASTVVIDDFESGGISGWYSGSYLGYSTATSTQQGSFFDTLAGTASGVVVAMSSTISPPQCPQDPWNVQCPLPMPFLPSGAALPTYVGDNQNGHGTIYGMYGYGAYLGRDIQVSAGDVLNWRWAAYGEGAPLGGGFDHVRFMAIGENDQFWFDAHGPDESFVFSQAGAWSIYFGIAQSEDPQQYSAVVLDSITLNTVPEPGSLALSLLAGGVLWQSRRRSRSAIAREPRALA